MKTRMAHRRLRRYAAGVDLVLSGHVHAYERTHPTYKYQCVKTSHPF